MENQRRTWVLGLFVLGGVVLLIAGLLVIGAGQFGSNKGVVVSGVFDEVDGLRAGNRVRLGGVNVGAVTDVQLTDDARVVVRMQLEQDVAQRLGRDALLRIGSDGLMGDKLMVIVAGRPGTAPLQSGDQLRTESPTTVADMLRALQHIGDDAQGLATEMTDLLRDLRQPQSTVGQLLTDTLMFARLEGMLTLYEQAGARFKGLTSELSDLAAPLQAGEGTLGRLLQDETLADQVVATTDSLRQISQRAARAATELEAFTQKLNAEENGFVNRMLTDPALADEVAQTLRRVGEAAEGIEQTTTRLNRSWLLGGRRDKRPANAADEPQEAGQTPPARAEKPR